ncbi:MAG: hypothetical protein K2G70_00480 [Turicibacter sp.]|nr:hypothetical protein [Turicibacter sp.]
MKKLLLLDHLPLIFTKIKDYITSVLPVAATTSKAGIVKPGTGLSVSADGTLAVDSDAVVGAALPTASATVKGGIKVGKNLTIVDGVLSAPNPVTKVSELTNDSGYQTADNVKSTVDTAIASIVDGAPETFDTLKEVADYIENHKSVETALNAAIGNKADKTSVYTKTEADAKFATIASYATDEEVESALTEVFG